MQTATWICTTSLVSSRVSDNSRRATDEVKQTGRDRPKAVQFPAHRVHQRQVLEHGVLIKLPRLSACRQTAFGLAARVDDTMSAPARNPPA